MPVLEGRGDDAAIVQATAPRRSAAVQRPQVPAHSSPLPRGRQERMAEDPGCQGLMLRLIASTGLRVSEAIGLQRKHLQLDGGRPYVRVRRAIVKRRIEPPKT